LHDSWYSTHSVIGSPTPSIVLFYKLYTQCIPRLIIWLVVCVCVCVNVLHHVSIRLYARGLLCVHICLCVCVCMGGQVRSEGPCLFDHVVICMKVSPFFYASFEECSSTLRFERLIEGANEF